MDALCNDDAVLVALHLAISTGLALLKVVPGDIRLLAVGQLGDAGHQLLHVDAVRGLPVGGLRGTLIQRQEEVIHAQQTHMDSQILQILLQTHGGSSLTAAGGTRQRHQRLFALVGENGGRRRTDLIVEHLLTPQHELRLASHGVVDVLQINDSHNRWLLSLRRSSAASLHPSCNIIRRIL